MSWLSDRLGVIFIAAFGQRLTVRDVSPSVQRCELEQDKRRRSVTELDSAKLSRRTLAKGAAAAAAATQLATGIGTIGNVAAQDIPDVPRENTLILRWSGQAGRFVDQELWSEYLVGASHQNGLGHLPRAPRLLQRLRRRDHSLARRVLGIQRRLHRAHHSSARWHHLERRRAVQRRRCRLYPQLADRARARGHLGRQRPDVRGYGNCCRPRHRQRQR